MTNKSFIHVRPRKKEFTKCPYPMPGIQAYGGKGISHEKLKAILGYWVATNEPPSSDFAWSLLRTLEVAMSGHETNVFSRPKTITKRLAHPIAEMLALNAVMYINACKKYKYDNHPVKTITEICGVGRSTVYRWQDKYKDSDIVLGVDIDEESAEGILDALKSLYLKYKPL